MTTTPKTALEPVVLPAGRPAIRVEIRRDAKQVHGGDGGEHIVMTPEAASEFLRPPVSRWVRREAS